MAASRHDVLRPHHEVNTPALSIVYRNVGELKLDPRNPRRHSKKQIKQIGRSIQTFGFSVPLIIDENLRVISGHGRLAAAKLIGIEQVPTICVAHLSEAQIRTFQIADNRLTENSTWDKTALAQELQILQNASLDFDLESTGFEIPEINLLTLGLESKPATQPQKLSKELINRDFETAVSRPGDLWVLSDHRLVCGSAWEEETYALLTNGRRAAAVLTHVPGGDVELLLELFSELVEHSDPAALQFIFADHLLMKNLATAEQVGLRLLDVCVAVKPHAEVAPGRLYQKQHDLVFVFRNGNAEPSCKPQAHRSNVWFYESARQRRAYGKRKAQLVENQLPVALSAEAITDSTERGGIVLDPFLGAGTTLIAAEQTERACYGIESEPIELDQAVRRWQELTGKTAVHEKCGMSFDQVGEERDGEA